MVNELIAIKIYEIAESGDTAPQSSGRSERDCNLSACIFIRSSAATVISSAPRTHPFRYDAAHHEINSVLSISLLCCLNGADCLSVLHLAYAAQCATSSCMQHDKLKVAHHK